MSDDLSIFIISKNTSYRRILSSIVSAIPNAELSGMALHGKFAFSKIALLKPDLVLLDSVVSGEDRTNTIEQIKNDFPDIEIIMISGGSIEDADTTVKALETGAIDFVSKPEQRSPSEILNELAKALTPILKLAITRKHCRRIKDSTATTETALPRKKASPAFRKPKKNPPPEKIEVVALGVSTGGPNALIKVIPHLKPDFPVPILAVQHMPPRFISSLTKRLNMYSHISVTEGKEGQKVKKGAMYIAPGNSHMMVKKNYEGNAFLVLTDSKPVNSCKPAIDVLFRSIREVYGGNVLTVILTGMGKDGADGVSLIREKGGYSIVQDERTSVIWGMPGEIVKARDADEVLSLEKIAARITELVHKARH